MPKFIALRDNFSLGRYIKEGEIVEHGKLPNKHFSPCDDFGAVQMPPVLKAVTKRPDVMAPAKDRTSGPVTLSEVAGIQNAHQHLKTGMNAGNEPEQQITPKSLKRKVAAAK